MHFVFPLEEDTIDDDFLFLCLLLKTIYKERNKTKKEEENFEI